MVVDVAGFGDLRRTNINQLAVRCGLYRVLSQGFLRAGIPWDDCRREDRGDGVLVVVPPTVPKSPFVESLPLELLALLRKHNDTHSAEEQIRLRMALHAGEIHHDEHGVAGRAVNLAFRLVDAPAFRQALAQSSDQLAVIASEWFYEEVVWHVAATGYHQVAVEAKETSTTAWICFPGSGAQVAQVAPVPALRQLPTESRQFVGRDAEIGRLMGLLDKAMADMVIITAIDGSAGIGKTALALHWAHRVKDRFPDGHLHVNLRGFDPGEPMDAGQALHDFLQSLGVAPKSIPAELDAKAALYRSRLAGKRILILLDNARSAEHVRPLLPGTSSCVAIITSRNRLDSLIVREGALRITLDLMSTKDALALLSERVGETRLASEPRVVAELIDLCARLPLALSIVAARAADFPAVPLSVLVRELREERDRLDAFDRGELDLSVRTVFSWSHKVLSSAAARLFRLLGIHPGPDIDLRAGDVLAGGPSRASLNELTRAHMLTEYVPGRYRFHDLLRAYAAELAEHEAEWQATAERMLDYYLERALRADMSIQPCRDGVVRSSPGDSTYGEAMAWFARENMVLLAAVTFAAERGFTGHAWRLAWACTTFLRREGRYSDRVAVHRTAATASRRSADRLGLATALRNLGRALVRLERLEEAFDTLGEALSVYEEMNDELGRVTTLIARIYVLGRMERQAEAVVLAESLRDLTTGQGNQLVEADVLQVLCNQLSALQRYTEAMPGFERALALYRTVGNKEGEAGVLLSLGKIELDLGRHAKAFEHYLVALKVERELGDRYWEAVVLNRLGEVHASQGQLAQARRLFAQSLAIFDEIHHPDAESVRVKLA
jgi:tetratricopeptide (TPR) repeat protein